MPSRRGMTLFRLSLVAAFTAVLAGCGGVSDAPKTVPATGVVTYNGSPVPKASLTFAPESAAPDARGGTANTNDKGEFEVATSSSAPGLLPGNYKVIVQAYKKNPAELRPAEATQLGDSNLAVPKKYTDGKTTDAKVTVANGGSKDLKIELKD